MSDRAPLLLVQEAEIAALMISNLNSMALDFATRNAVGGTDLSYFIIKQLPVLSPAAFLGEIFPDFTSVKFIVPRAIEITYTAWDLEPFAKDCGYGGPPFIWNEDRRFLIRAELDAAFFHLYLGNNQEWQRHGPKELIEYFPTPRHAVDYIMETFPIVKRKDEKQYGEYRTKRVILEIYDEMARVMEENAAAMAAGRQPPAQYQTRLDPPPGPPVNAEGNFIPMAQWTSWPVHIHPPKDKVQKIPEEIPLEEFVAMTYPYTETDNLICAVALAIVEKSKALSSMNHLDMLLLATHPDWCKMFLDENNHSAFNATKQSAPRALFIGEGQSIRWKDCRDYLEQQRQAISINCGNVEQTITLGTEWISVKASLPSGVDDMVKYAMEAMKRINDLRKDLSSVPQEQLRIIQAFKEQQPKTRPQ